MLLTLMLALILNDPLDELHVGKFLSSASHKQWACVSYMDGMVGRVSLFDFKTQTWKTLNDSRMSFMLPLPLPATNGFLILNPVPRNNPTLYLISPEGENKGKWACKDIAGWATSFEFQSAQPYESEEFLFTVKHNNEIKILLLDSKMKSFALVTTWKNPDNLKKLAIFRKGNLIEATLETMEIVQRKMDSSLEKHLVQARAIRSNSSPFRSSLPQKGHEIRIEMPIVTDSLIQFRAYRDLQDEERVGILAIDSQGRVQWQDRFVLASFENRSLCFDLSTNEFSLTAPKR